METTKESLSDYLMRMLITEKDIIHLTDSQFKKLVFSLEPINKPPTGLYLGQKGIELCFKNHEARTRILYFGFRLDSWLTINYVFDYLEIRSLNPQISEINRYKLIGDYMITRSDKLSFFAELFEGYYGKKGCMELHRLLKLHFYKPEKK